MKYFRAITVVPSAARTTNGDSTTSPVLDMDLTNELILTLNVSAVSGTSPSLTVTLVYYDENTDQWFPIASYAAKATVGQETLRLSGIFGKKLAAEWTISGDSSSFTFSVSGYAAER